MIHNKALQFDIRDKLLCSVAAAILGAGALGAGASIYGSTNAANAQTAAGNNAINFQKQVLGTNMNLLQPFISGGQNQMGNLSDWINPNSTSNPLSALIKLTTPGASMSDTLAQTPGYQFAEDRGLRAVNNSLAARGLAGSPGAAVKGAGDFVTGLASGTWQSVVNALQSLFTGGAGALQSAVNTGANAAGNFAGGAIKSGTDIGGNMVGIGNANAASNNAIASAIGNFGNSASTAAILQKLLGNSGGAGGGGGGIYGTPAVAGNPWSAGGTGDANYWGNA